MGVGGIFSLALFPLYCLYYGGYASTIGGGTCAPTMPPIKYTYYVYINNKYALLLAEVLEVALHLYLYACVTCCLALR